MEQQNLTETDKQIQILCDAVVALENTKPRSDLGDYYGVLSETLDRVRALEFEASTHVVEDEEDIAFRNFVTDRFIDQFVVKP